MSNIDPTVPIYGNPTTQSVRDNFAHAKAEIEDLDARKLNSADAAAAYLPLAGGTMTGNLTLFGDPTADLQPATRRYTLNLLAGYLPLAGGTMQGPISLASAPVAPSHAANKGYVDSNFVALTGAAMTGLLLLSGDPQAALGAATRQYVDSKSASVASAYLPLAGGVMTGTLTLAGDPAGALDAATRQWVQSEDGKRLALAGGQMTGSLLLKGAPSDPNEAANKNYVDQQIAAGGVPDAPTDGKTYGRVSSTWSPVLPISGGTLTGLLTLAADPTQNLHAATMQWTLARDALLLPLAGGTMTGNLTIGQNTTANPSLTLNGAAGQNRFITFQTAGKLRWLLYGDGSAESGGNAGTNLCINRYADDGTTYLSQPFSITRSTGLVYCNNGLFVQGGNLTIASGTAAISAAAGVERALWFQTAGSARWEFGTSGTAESGSNAGSDIFINRFSDAGAYIDTPFIITRSNGRVTLQDGLTVNSGGVAAGSNGSISTGGQMLAGFYLAGKSGGGQGGFLGSWNAGNNDYQGMWSASGGTLCFGFSDLFGNPNVWYGSFDKSGNLNVSGAIQNNSGNITAKGGLYANGGTALGLFSDGGNGRYLAMDSNWRWLYNADNGMRSWQQWQGSTLETLDASGNYWANGNVAAAQALNAGNGVCYLGSASTSYVQYSTNVNLVQWSNSGGNIVLQSNGGALTFNNGGAWKPGGGPWNDSSDARIKRVTGDYRGGLDALLKLRPRRFIYLGNDIALAREPTREQLEERMPDIDLPVLRSHHADVAEREEEFIGLVAQEAEAAMPELVSRRAGLIDGEFVQDLRILDTAPLTWAMVNAFREVDARLRALESRT